MKIQWTLSLLIFLIGCSPPQEPSLVLETPTPHRSTHPFDEVMRHPDQFQDEYVYQLSKYRAWPLKNVKLTRDQHRLRRSAIMTQQHNPKAIDLWKKIQPYQLSPDDQLMYWEVRTLLAKQGSNLADLIEAEKRAQLGANHTHTWSVLGHTPTMLGGDEGWRELNQLLINHAPRNAFQQWKNLFPNHYLHQHIQNNPIWPELQHVYFWLPEHPSTADIATQDALFSAYFYKRQPNWSFEVIPEANIATLKELTKHDWLVGYFDEERLQTLHRINPKLHLLTLKPITNPQPNTLILNPDPHFLSHDLLYHAAQSGFQQALLITYQNELSPTDIQNLRQTWEHLGGTWTDTIVLTEGQESSQLASKLGITDSINRKSHWEKLLKKPISGQPYRRHDFDIIFLLTPKDKLTNINPLLTYYYTQTPRYTWHTIASKQHQWDDINHFIFPQSISYKNLDQPILTELKQNHPRQFHQRLPAYELGIDAYHLLDQLSTLNIAPKYKLSSLGHHITLDAQQQLAYRDYIWYTIKNQRIIPLELL